MRLTKSFAAACLLAIAACSQGGHEGPAAAAASQPSTHPESGLAVVPLKVTSKGKVHHFRVEVAATPQQQQKGLMFRTAMGPDEGMVFPFDPPRPASFWMRNTVIPLDIIFVGPDHRVLNIAAEAVPYDETPRTSDGRAIAVLELIGGRAAQLGIAPGDKVEWRKP